MEPSVAELTMPIDSVAAGSVHMSNASQTEIRVEYIKHNWTVKNFSHCYQEYLENYVNLPRGDDVLTWSIKIYPKGNGENNKDFVFLCLNRVIGNNVKSNKIGFRNVRSRFFLKNSDGKDIEMRVHPNPSHSDYVSYIKRDVLFPQISPADSITVFVEIDVAVETITTVVDDNITTENNEKILADDLYRLYTERRFTDFVIRVNDRDIPVHRAILAARSPFFDVMLNHEDTAESKTFVPDLKNQLSIAVELPRNGYYKGTMIIQDMDYAVVDEMLKFIYSTKTTPEVNDMASDLLIAADKYRLDELKNICERNLIQALCLDNACQLLIIGDMCRAELLRQKAVKFILQHTKEITATSGWDTVIASHPQLVTDIVRSFDIFCGPTSSISSLIEPQSHHHQPPAPHHHHSHHQTNIPTGGLPIANPSAGSSGNASSSAVLPPYPASMAVGIPPGPSAIGPTAASSSAAAGVAPSVGPAAAASLYCQPTNGGGGGPSANGSSTSMDR